MTGISMGYAFNARMEEKKAHEEETSKSESSLAL